MALRKRWAFVNANKILAIILAPFLFTMATQILRSLFGLGNLSETAAIAISVLFLIVWVGLIFASANDDAKKSETADDKTDLLLSNIQKLEMGANGGKVLYLGRTESSKVMSSLRRAVSGAALVRNTLIGCPQRDVEATETQELYQAFFKKARATAKWQDLATAHELFGPRFRMDLRVGDVGRRHEVRALRHGVPLINFTIVDMEDGTRSVHFGWIYEAAPSLGMAFYSEDLEIVNMFDGYFTHLWNQKTVGSKNEQSWVDYQQRPPSLKGNSLVDRAGTWITLGKDGELTESYAVVRIGFESAPSVTGNIYDRELYFKGGIQGFNIDVSTDRLHFDYPINHEVDPRGRCQYRFYKGAGSKDLMRGFFVNDQGKKWKDVFGVKYVGPEVEDKLLIHRYKGELEMLSKGAPSDDRHHPSQQAESDAGLIMLPTGNGEVGTTTG